MAGRFERLSEEVRREMEQWRSQIEDGTLSMLMVRVFFEEQGSGDAHRIQSNVETARKLPRGQSRGGS